MSRPSASLSVIVRSTCVTFLILILVWIGAWLLKLYLQQQAAWLTTSGGSFLYWLVAKVLVWILPAFWLLRLPGNSIQDVFNISNYRAWLSYGMGIGLLIGLTGMIPNYLQGKAMLPTTFSWPLVNVLVIAPIFEEFLLRGAVLTNLQKGYSFPIANIITSIFFVVLHLPGWFFGGTLVENLTNPFGGALSIFLLSVAFGYAAHRSRSVMGGILAHFLNNLLH